MSKYSDFLDDLFYGKSKLEKAIYVVGAFAAVIVVFTIIYNVI